MSDRRCVREAVPAIHRGVGVLDTKLEEEFGLQEVKPIILGGIVASENIKSFLRLPLKFRTSPRL